MTPSFIDLFCGAGGLSLGLTRAGWQPLLAVDNWSDAVASYQRNFLSHPVLKADISTLECSDIEDELLTKPTWIVGGPPCQGFSTVGKREKDDPRNFMVRDFARLVESMSPEGFLVENVLGLRDMNFFGAISKLFEEIGYKVTILTLKAADFGIPQLRRRVVFVGDRFGRCFIPPTPTHSADDYVTVWDAIGDLPRLENGRSVTEYDREPFSNYQYQMRDGSTFLQGHQASRHPATLVQAIAYIPDGGNRRHIPPRYQPRSGYHNSYSRLHSASPAVAVTQNMGKPSGTRCIHPFQHRGLSAREGARLQSFPDSFHFTGGITSQRLQVANAVPPLLATRLGLALNCHDNWIATGKTVEEQLPLGETLELVG